MNFLENRPAWQSGRETMVKGVGAYAEKVLSVKKEHIRWAKITVIWILDKIVVL